MDDKEVRLRIAEAIIAVAPRNEINDSQKIVDRCKIIETYVVGEQSSSAPKVRRKRNGNEQDTSQD